MSDVSDRIKANLVTLRERISAAARRSDRSPEEITLVVVTKYVGPEIIQILFQHGCNEIGESRPQELWRKFEQCRDLPIRWHLVGPLQRNKAQRTVPLVSLIHSVESRLLLETLDRCGQKLGHVVPVLLEVNISGESAKHGFPPEEIPKVVDQLDRFPRVEVRGLMGISGLNITVAEIRRQFATLRELRDRLVSSGLVGPRFTELSMGMSGDFEVAIEEGATIIRVGSALFEGIETG